MANKDSPQGLRPIRHQSGAPYNGSGCYHSTLISAFSYTLTFHFITPLLPNNF